MLALGGPDARLILLERVDMHHPVKDDRAECSAGGVGRFLRRERETFPAPPQRYFDQPSAQALEAFRIRAFADRSPDLMERFPPTAMREPLISAGRASAVRLYRNWLSYLAARRETACRPVSMVTPELARP